ncbi:MAG: putative polymerase [Nitrospira sp.]|jgi:DNA polymerase-4|nr:putative polymerase [Nitrospira sp.]
MDRHIVCLHIPSFGIALAQTREVSLRNRPVALAPVHTPRALVREASHEALIEGIRPGMSVELARRLCPNLRLVAPDSSLLRAAHHELQQAIQPFAPAWESIRPGSLFLDLTGTKRLLGPPIDTAARVGRELAVQRGWHSVIGLAGNKLVSQLAATTLGQPPRIRSIYSGSEQQFLAPLPATLLPGLDRQASHILRRLDDLNLRTFGSIAAVSPAQLESVFGAAAGLLHDWALGIDPSPVRPPVEQPVIEHSITLDPDEIDDRLILGRLYRLIEQVCAMLRQQRRVCKRLSLTVRHSDHAEQTAQQALPQGTYWEMDLQPVLAYLLLRCFKRRVRLQRLTLRVDRLEPPAEQLLLFDQSAALMKPASHRLSFALDAIRAKFGEQAISWGRTLP